MAAIQNKTTYKVSK